jgi:hypothetical protein
MDDSINEGLGWGGNDHNPSSHDDNDYVLILSV